MKKIIKHYPMTDRLIVTQRYYCGLYIWIFFLLIYILSHSILLLLLQNNNSYFVINCLLVNILFFVLTQCSIAFYLKSFKIFFFFFFFFFLLYSTAMTSRIHFIVILKHTVVTHTNEVITQELVSIINMSYFKSNSQ